jgi:VIT1/CCC1 family predicted Fe2+/Mn2+ transporter
LRGTLRMLVWGALALLITALVGKVVGTAI